MSHEFKLTVSGSKQEATQKIKAMATLGQHLTGSELQALAQFIKSGNPSEIAMAKNYLGLK